MHEGPVPPNPPLQGAEAVAAAVGDAVDAVVGACVGGVVGGDSEQV